MKFGAAQVHAVVPYVHVADVERSIDFYRLLGFEVIRRWPCDGKPGAAFIENSTCMSLTSSHCAND
jgi:catechol 2,3-dioxygenase-like lactoylglutathione lyase family enzyme